MKYNTIDEAIEADIRKEPYKNYNTSVDLFNLDIKEMQEVIAKGSYYAQLAKIEGNNSGVYSVSLESGYYDAYFDLINKENDNNEFGITHFMVIDEGVENDYDNTKETDSYIETYIGRQQGFNNSYSESIENGATNRTNDDIHSKQSQQQGFNEKGQITEKNIGNSKELDNSSFSLDKNAKRYDDLTETSYIEYFVKDNNNNTIIVPIESKTTTANNINIDINRVKSIYGYDKPNPDLNKYIKDNINTNKFTKIFEQKKETPMSKSQGVLPYANNIPQSNEKVKSDTLPTNSNMKKNCKIF